MSTTSPAAVTGRRRVLLEAAVKVVADEGLRGLTHRAVDRRAGLAEGTTSAYLRTRQALQTALAEYVAAALAADVDHLAATLADHRVDHPMDGPSGHAEAVELTLQLFERWLDERELLVAKLELSMQAARDPDLAALLNTWRNRLVGVVDSILTSRDLESCGDHPDRSAEAMVASFDGLLIAAMQKPQPERRSFLSGSLSLIMEALTRV